MVVYLHGFSATRQEIAPVPEQVAASLGANLFETRLAGHGRLRERLSGVPAEAWLRDGAEALAIGRALGDRLILVGTSTGATLALAMAAHEDFAQVESLVLISPNFGPAAPGSGLATGPYGPQLLRLLAGKTHRWEAANALQERFWTTSYPSDAIVEMLRLVDHAATLSSRVSIAKALLIYSPKDDVVSVEKLIAGFETLDAGQKRVHRVDEPQSLSSHVLTGDILAPEATAGSVALISAFLGARDASQSPPQP